MKSMLITGGTGAVGSCVTRRLLQDECYCHVPYRNQGEADKLAGEISGLLSAHLAVHHCDMTSEKAIGEMFDAIAASENELYGLVHLVGGVKSFQPVADTAVEDWDFLMNLNLRSYFLAARKAMQVFRANGKGRIIAIASMQGLKPAANHAGYGVAKSGVIALTKILADEGRKHGVTANCIAPSIIRTDVNLEWGSEEQAREWVTPEEIAETITFLLSDKAASINGTVVQAFGGMNV